MIFYVRERKNRNKEVEENNIFREELPGKKKEEKKEKFERKETF